MDERYASEFFDHAFSILTEDASYVASSKSSRERNLPSAPWFELIVWNVLVAFLVNLLSSFAFDGLQRLRRHGNPSGDESKSKESDLEKRLLAAQDHPLDSKLLAEGLQAIKILKPGDDLSLKAANDIAIEAAANVLCESGWPRDLALRRAQEISAHISKNASL